MIANAEHVTVSQDLSLYALSLVLNAVCRTEIDDTVLTAIEFNHGVLA